MSFLTLLLIALGVSADAFAVAVGKGLTMRRFDARAAWTIGIAFGLAQALMPLAGWLLGWQLEQYITPVDHWIAFGLLALVGGKLLHEARSDGHDGEDEHVALAAAAVDPSAGSAVSTLARPTTRPMVGGRELVLLAVATSIDALAVGVSFAFLDVDILLAVAVIGVITLLVSFGGVALGQRAGARLRGPAELVGGLVLIGMGVKILLEHLGVF